MFQSTETGKQKQLFPSTEVLHGVVLIIVWSIFFCRDFPGTGKGLPRSSRGFVESTSSSILVGIFHDLGLQVVLVAENVALPLDNFLLFANPDFFCNLVDQPEVVRDKKDSALKFIDGLSQSVDGLHIQVISRFVEQQQRCLMQ